MTSEDRKPETIAPESTERALGSGASMLCAKVPSAIIPFTGSFPLVEFYLQEKSAIEVQSHCYFDDLPEWLKPKIRIARFISDLQNSFIDFLTAKGYRYIKDYLLEDEQTRDKILQEWMDENCIGDNYLDIK